MRIRVVVRRELREPRPGPWTRSRRTRVCSAAPRRCTRGLPLRAISPTGRCLRPALTAPWICLGS